MRRWVYITPLWLSLALPVLSAQSRPQLDEAIGLAVAAEYEEALVLFKKELALHPEDPLRHYLVGITEFKLGNFRIAAGRFSVALEKRADFPQVHYWLARAYQELGDNDGAVKALEKGLQRYPNNPDLTSLEKLLGAP